LAKPQGDICHLGQPSCFEKERAGGIGFLAELWKIIEARYQERPKGSYTTKLFDAGPKRIAQKVGEEAVEVALAADNTSELLEESADLIYHLFVLLKANNSNLADVVEVLRKRHLKK
jgi:phosphoribosyl-ATP pyrophosphohydrolase/phosphoribosyl-AMP cyclohydrolase